MFIFFHVSFAIKCIMVVIVTCKNEEDPIQRPECCKGFPNYYPMGFIFCQGNQSFDPTCIKT